MATPLTRDQLPADVTVKTAGCRWCNKRRLCAVLYKSDMKAVSLCLKEHAHRGMDEGYLTREEVRRLKQYPLVRPAADALPPQPVADDDIVLSSEVSSMTTIKIIFNPGATGEQMRAYLDRNYPSPKWNDKLFGNIALVFLNPYHSDNDSDDESEDEDSDDDSDEDSGSE